MAINSKKEDTVKIKNHCTQKIRLWYLQDPSPKVSKSGDTHPRQISLRLRNCFCTFLCTHFFKPQFSKSFDNCSFHGASEEQRKYPPLGIFFCLGPTVNFDLRQFRRQHCLLFVSCRHSSGGFSWISINCPLLYCTLYNTVQSCSVQ